MTSDRRHDELHAEETFRRTALFGGAAVLALLVLIGGMPAAPGVVLGDTALIVATTLGEPVRRDNERQEARQQRTAEREALGIALALLGLTAIAPAELWIETRSHAFAWRSRSTGEPRPCGEPLLETLVNLPPPRA